MFLYLQLCITLSLHPPSYSNVRHNFYVLLSDDPMFIAVDTCHRSVIMFTLLVYVSYSIATVYSLVTC